MAYFDVHTLLRLQRSQELLKEAEQQRLILPLLRQRKQKRREHLVAILRRVVFAIKRTTLSAGRWFQQSRSQQRWTHDNEEII